LTFSIIHVRRSSVRQSYVVVVGCKDTTVVGISDNEVTVVLIHISIKTDQFEYNTYLKEDVIKLVLKKVVVEVIVCLKLAVNYVGIVSRLTYNGDGIRWQLCRKGCR
jgi:hypothetical protein